ncbi:hypothetical protein J3R83DRAFT_5281 [Lanmaoa asiatica]|nr:hypothetical protein J3R83DRAFT_5281 [Lanmaoa asiatica]
MHLSRIDHPRVPGPHQIHHHPVVRRTLSRSPTSFPRYTHRDHRPFYWRPGGLDNSRIGGAIVTNDTVMSFSLRLAVRRTGPIKQVQMSHGRLCHKTGRRCDRKFCLLVPLKTKQRKSRSVLPALCRSVGGGFEGPTYQ